MLGENGHSKFRTPHLVKGSIVQKNFNAFLASHDILSIFQFLPPPPLWHIWWIKLELRTPPPPVNRRTETLKTVQRAALMLTLPIGASRELYSDVHYGQTSTTISLVQRNHSPNLTSHNIAFGNAYTIVQLKHVILMPTKHYHQQRHDHAI